jgi:hypothetical protein
VPGAGPDQPSFSDVVACVAVRYEYLDDREVNAPWFNVARRWKIG